MSRCRKKNQKEIETLKKEEKNTGKTDKRKSEDGKITNAKVVFEKLNTPGASTTTITKERECTTTQKARGGGEKSTTTRTCEGKKQHHPT